MSEVLPPVEARARASRFCLLCIGSMLHGALHNMGNALVSAMGNYDLAISSLTSSDLSNALERLKALGEAVDRLGEIHNRLSQLSAPSGASPQSMPCETYQGVLSVVRACCGRTLDLILRPGSEEALAEAPSPGPLNGAVALGLLTWAFEQVQRNGSITVSVSQGREPPGVAFEVEWASAGGPEKASGGSGSSLAAYLLETVSDLARSSGTELCLEDEREGPVSRGLARAILPDLPSVLRG
ncbi:hypothetical protein JW921_10740 [Candidatus Fermentibacterales bacterium]|nr:hypothetical protein [Candidatus Fermentibacterales bacterium]